MSDERMYEKIRDHIGHEIVAVGYQFQNPAYVGVATVNVAIECERCYVVIVDADNVGGQA